MKGYWLLVIGLLLSVAAFAEDSLLVAIPDTVAVEQPVQPEQPAKPAKPKKQIYGGTMVKFDILSPILTPALRNWQMQHYEVAVNVRLAKRWYPTFELGYTGGKTHNDSVNYVGQGGFFRVGCDLNPLKKRPDSPHALLVGLRLGTGMQQFDTNRFYADCWGEIVAGCQVEIAKVNNTAFYMGWMGRFKVLFTRKSDNTPIYIPGFGSRDNIGWGANYYLGWRF